MSPVLEFQNIYGSQESSCRTGPPAYVPQPYFHSVSSPHRSTVWCLEIEQEKGLSTGPTGYIGWRNKFLESIPGLLKSLKIQSLYCTITRSTCPLGTVQAEQNVNNILVRFFNRCLFLSWLSQSSHSCQLVQIQNQQKRKEPRQLIQEALGRYSYILGRWVAMLIARLLATAALWV